MTDPVCHGFRVSGVPGKIYELLGARHLQRYFKLLCFYTSPYSTIISRLLPETLINRVIMLRMSTLRRKPASLGDSDEPPHYTGSGNASDPFVVEFLHADPRNPLNYSLLRKIIITIIVTTSVFAVTLTSSAFSGGGHEIMAEFQASSEVFALGIALFVLGFAVGPALWAPLSELYGRRILFILTHALTVAFIAASAGSNSMASLLVFR